MHAAIPIHTERVVRTVIGAAIEVHRALGPGFIERIYEDAMCIELAARQVPFERECPIVVPYRGVDIAGQRIDLIVDRSVIVELKAVVNVEKLHEMKVISYLRTTGLRVGQIFNFHAVTIVAGMKRIVV